MTCSQTIIVRESIFKNQNLLMFRVTLKGKRGNLLMFRVTLKGKSEINQI